VRRHLLRLAQQRLFDSDGGREANVIREPRGHDLKANRESIVAEANRNRDCWLAGQVRWWCEFVEIRIDL
jgi:hypothetical protein